MNSPKPLWKGIVLMISAWAFFAFMSALAKYSYTYTDPIVAFFFQNFVGLLFLLPYFFKTGTGWLRSDRWSLLFLRGAIGALSFFLLFSSLSKIPLTDGTLLNNSAPLFVPFLAALFLRTPLKLSICLSAALGFLGIILILKPTGELFQLNAMPALISGFLSGLVMIIVRMLASENPKRIIFVYFLIGSLSSAPFAIPHIPDLPLAAFLPLAGVGIFFASAQMCYTRSFHYAEPTVLAPFSYSFVVISGIIDWIFWNHAPTMLSALGILLILVGGILTIRYSRIPAPQRSNLA